MPDPVAFILFDKVLTVLGLLENEENAAPIR
jgi:hypothetical protein